MTDEKTETPAPPPADQPQAEADTPSPVAERPATHRGWAWLLVLLVLAAIGVSGWQGYLWARSYLASRDAELQGLRSDLAALSTQGNRLQTKLSDQSLALERNVGEMTKLAQRVDAGTDAIGRLREEMGGGRSRVQLALVEQLLMLANDRLQVGREVAAAVTALDAADARLAAIKEPRLFPVREAISKERAALQAVPLPDEEGAALTLSSLIDRVPRLPLAAEMPTDFVAHPSAETAPPADATGLQKAWHAMRRAVASIFAIRRADGPPPQLLGDEQQALVRQVMSLRLEGARVALLRRNTTAFRDLCGAGIKWLDDYFHATDPGVAAVRAELVRLQSLQLDPPLPDISQSLALLRAQMDAGAQ